MHRVLMLFVSATLAAPAAVAQDAYPSRPITMVVAFPPGGVADITARPTAFAMEKLLKQRVIIENKPGAAGATGNAYVANAKPDGYTLLMALSSISVIPEAERLQGHTPPYELNQLAPIALISADPVVLVVRQEAPWKTVKDFVADAKKRPGGISYSSSGIFGALHMPFTLLEHATGTTLWHVPYNGGGPAVQALLGAQVDSTVGGPAAMIGQIRAKKFRPLASFGGKRLASLPDVPTLKELGIDAEYYIWAGLLAPAATPATVQKKLRDAVRQAVQDPDFRNAMAKVETPINYLDAPDFRTYWDADAKKLTEAVKRVKIVEQKK
jgi:tripartite-type tricarboxylate transporter receptor subunit TctC